jgi:nucleoside-diphosphate-sugar epimerase
MEPIMNKSILITGADGYLGSKLAKTMLLETDAHLILWMRAGNQKEFDFKKALMSARLQPGNKRVSFETGDLRAEKPFASIDRRSVGAIIHSAAVTRFNVDEITARKVNLEGSEKLFSFAGECNHLERLSLISTVYASGLRKGPIAEMPITVSSFSNRYEQSKWQSEHSLVTSHRDLPWQILRTATIIADDSSGTVTQQNAFHNTLKLFYYGLLSLVPGRTCTPLYFVGADFAATAILKAWQQPRYQSVFHISHRKDESITLGKLITIAFETFSEDPGFKKRRILPPLYADAKSFDLFSQTIETIDSGLVSKAVSSISPFAKQLFIEKDIYNDNTMKNIPDYNVPDPEQFISNTCRYLVKTKWGLASNHAA